MSLAVCTIRFADRADKAVYMSGSLLKTLQLSGVKNTTVRLGKQAVSAGIKTVNQKGNLLILPTRLRSELRVPKSGKCMVSSSAKELRIGPLIGILTSFPGGSASSPFGHKSPLIRSYMAAAAGKAMCYAFRPKDVNWRAETVFGYMIRPNGGWVRRTFPLPDVVYNRLGSRSAEKSAAMENFKNRFTSRSIPIFNWSFFDKGDVYSLLHGDEADRYVPESHIGPTPEKLRDMLERHRFVYLKPTGGSLGIGIYRITYHPARGYFVRFRRGGKNVLLRFTRFSALMGMLTRSKGRMRNYVVQQGIRLIELDNCPIDFRFHLNKNNQNQWVVAGIGAKKAGKGSVTTHVKNGGQVMTPEQVLSRVYGGRADQVLQNAKQVAIRLAEAIERNYRHRLGELGFDIGIDYRERIWMFEANSKPGRSIFKHPSLKSEGKASLAHIIDHCIYLSNFRKRRD